MTEVTSTLIALVGTSTLALGLFLGRLLARYRNTSGSATPEVDTSRYQVMVRLTSSEDLEFLRAQPGFNKGMDAKFRRDRRRACRLYLKEITADFRRLHSAARTLASQAPAEHSELIGVLFRHQAAFWGSLGRIELRLMLGAGGISEMNLGGLLGNLDELRAALSRATPAGLPA